MRDALPGEAEAALQSLREIMGKLKLTVNEEKTRICKVPEGEFDFLGYTAMATVTVGTIRPACWSRSLPKPPR